MRAMDRIKEELFNAEEAAHGKICDALGDVVDAHGDPDNPDHKRLAKVVRQGLRLLSVCARVNPDTVMAEIAVLAKADREAPSE